MPVSLNHVKCQKNDSVLHEIIMQSLFLSVPTCVLSQSEVHFDLVIARESRPTLTRACCLSRLCHPNQQLERLSPDRLTP
jgi:hypothetical protein